MLNLTSLPELKGYVKKLGIEPKRSLGQNFLICPEVIEATIELAKAGAQSITELGPGIGTLTQALVMSDLTVTAIEKDDTLAEALPNVIPPRNRPQLTVIHGDLKTANWQPSSRPQTESASGEDQWQLVGNIPYNLSGLIIRKLTSMKPQQAILLVQAEVAERITAAPPNMSIIGLAVALWGKAQTILTVPPSCFWPSPKVTSALVYLQPENPLPEREEILNIAKVFFQQKRKQVSGTLRRHWGITDEKAKDILIQSNIIPTARPQELTVTQWKALYTVINKL